MKICIFGLWHLGTVTAACMADVGFEVVGIDPDPLVVQQLKSGKPPVFEPGLEELINKGLAGGALSFSESAQEALNGADLLWVTIDTPIDEEDNADINYVTGAVTELFPFLTGGTLVLISSQLPVGSTAKLEKSFCASTGQAALFAYSPENLRLGKAIDVLRNQERVVVGIRNEAGKGVIEEVFKPFGIPIIWMDTESAEMTKHALNTFFALSVTFANELASICERVGADAREVEEGLRSEPRVGRKVLIRPGGAFAGGTLARDVKFLLNLSGEHGLESNLFKSIIKSNDNHKGWAEQRLLDYFKDLSGKTVAVLGLTYKPGTDTLRRSTSIETCRRLLEQGAKVKAYDPVISEIPPELDLAVTVTSSVNDALAEADAVIVATEWDDFKELVGDDFTVPMKSAVVLDINRFLGSLEEDKRITYITVGRPI